MVSRKDQLLRILLAFDRHFDDDRIGHADVGRWDELKRHVVRIKEGLELALGELVSGAPANEEKVRKAPGHIRFGLGELDEQKRIDEVVEYHRRNHLPMGGSANLHGVAHVENQLAMGDPPAVREALARLMAEGLDRHDAAHAVASVMMGIVFDVVHKKGKSGGDINAQYARELATLTAASWRAQAD